MNILVVLGTTSYIFIRFIVTRRVGRVDICRLVLVLILVLCSLVYRILFRKVRNGRLTLMVLIVGLRLMLIFSALLILMIRIRLLIVFLVMRIRVGLGLRRLRLS